MVARPKQNLAWATVILMGTFVASRLTGLIRLVVCSNQFGTSPDYAAYLAGNAVPDFIFQVAAGGAVASAFIPVFTEYLAKGRNEEGWRFVSSLFNLALLVLVPVCGLLILFAPQVISLIAQGFDPALQEMASNQARIMLVSPIFFTLGCFSTSVLNSHHRFFLASLAPTIYNLSIIAGALFLAAPFGTYGLAIGSAVGAFLFFLSQVPGLRRVQMVYKPVLDLGMEGVREVGRLMAPRALGLAATQINFMVALYLASGMAEKYAALNYAWLLTMLPLGIFAMAISTAVFPTLAEQRALEQMNQLRHTFIKSLKLILYLTIPASIGLIVLRYPIIELLFQHDEFTAQSTIDTAFALQFYAAGLAALALIEIVTRAFYALHDTRTPVLTALGAMVINLALAVFLVKPLEQGGIALAATIASTIEAITLLYFLNRRLGGLDEKHLLVTIAKIVASSLTMGVAVYFFGSYINDHLMVNNLLSKVILVFSSIATGGICFGVISILLKCEEARYFHHFFPRSRWW